MELCDKTLENVINELTNDSILEISESLTTIGYYIASQIFIQILEGVNHLQLQSLQADIYSLGVIFQNLFALELIE
jgi:hypothetical protein